MRGRLKRVSIRGKPPKISPVHKGSSSSRRTNRLSHPPPYRKEGDPEQKRRKWQRELEDRYQVAIFERVESFRDEVKRDQWTKLVGHHPDHSYGNVCANLKNRINETYPFALVIRLKQNKDPVLGAHGFFDPRFPHGVLSSGNTRQFNQMGTWVHENLLKEKFGQRTIASRFPTLYLGHFMGDDNRVFIHPTGEEAEMLFESFLDIIEGYAIHRKAGAILIPNVMERGYRDVWPATNLYSLGLEAQITDDGEWENGALQLRKFHRVYGLPNMAKDVSGFENPYFAPGFEVVRNLAFPDIELGQKGEIPKEIWKESDPKIKKKIKEGKKPETVVSEILTPLYNKIDLQRDYLAELSPWAKTFARLLEEELDRASKESSTAKSRLAEKVDESTDSYRIRVTNLIAEIPAHLRKYFYPKFEESAEEYQNRVLTNLETIPELQSLPPHIAEATKVRKITQKELIQSKIHQERYYEVSIPLEKIPPRLFLLLEAFSRILHLAESDQEYRERVNEKIKNQTEENWIDQFQIAEGETFQNLCERVDSFLCGIENALKSLMRRQIPKDAEGKKIERENDEAFLNRVQIILNHAPECIQQIFKLNENEKQNDYVARIEKLLKQKDLLKGICKPDGEEDEISYCNRIKPDLIEFWKLIQFLLKPQKGENAKAYKTRVVPLIECLPVAATTGLKPEPYRFNFNRLGQILDPFKALSGKWGEEKLDEILSQQMDLQGNLLRLTRELLIKNNKGISGFDTLRDGQTGEVTGFKPCFSGNWKKLDERQGRAGRGLTKEFFLEIFCMILLDETIRDYQNKSPEINGIKKEIRTARMTINNGLKTLPKKDEKRLKRRDLKNIWKNIKDIIDSRANLNASVLNFLDEITSIKDEIKSECENLEFLVETDKQNLIFVLNKISKGFFDLILPKKKKNKPVKTDQDTKAIQEILDKFPDEKADLREKVRSLIENLKTKRNEFEDFLKGLDRKELGKMENLSKQYLDSIDCLSEHINQILSGGHLSTLKDIVEAFEKITKETEKLQKAEEEVQNPLDDLEEIPRLALEEYSKRQKEHEVSFLDQKEKFRRWYFENRPDILNAIRKVLKKGFTPDQRIRKRLTEPYIESQIEELIQSPEGTEFFDAVMTWGIDPEVLGWGENDANGDLINVRGRNGDKFIQMCAGYLVTRSVATLKWELLKPSWLIDLHKFSGNQEVTLERFKQIVWFHRDPSVFPWKTIEEYDSETGELKSEIRIEIPFTESFTGQLSNWPWQITDAVTFGTEEAVAPKRIGFPESREDGVAFGSYYHLPPRALMYAVARGQKMASVSTTSWGDKKNNQGLDFVPTYTYIKWLTETNLLAPIMDGVTPSVMENSRINWTSYFAAQKDKINQFVDFQFGDEKFEIGKHHPANI